MKVDRRPRQPPCLPAGSRSRPRMSGLHCAEQELRQQADPVVRTVALRSGPEANKTGRTLRPDGRKF